MNQIVSSLRQGSQDLERMNMLLKGPMQPWEGIQAEEVQRFDDVDLNGFIVLQDCRILDLREWMPGTDESDSNFVYGYQRLKVMQVAENSENTNFHLRLLPVAANSQFRFPSQNLVPALRSTTIETADSSLKRMAWEAVVDFSKTLKGELVDIVLEFRAPGLFLEDNGNSTSLTFESQVKTAENFTASVMNRFDSTSTSVSRFS